MADNPFEDEDVQAAAQSDGAGPPPVPQGNVYGNDAAYGDAIQAAAEYIPAEKKQEMAVAAGSAVANQAVNAAQADYAENTKTQQDHHEAPPPPNFCIKLFNWFPIRFFAFIGGCVLVGFPILAMIVGAPQFIQFFIYIYLIIFGVVTIFIESPTWKFTRYFQLKFFFWFRLLSRMWGRAWFYLFTAILCFAPVEEGGNSGIVMGFCGAYLIIIAILCWIFSRMAGTKFARMREFIAAGAEGDELEGRFMRKFDELDKGGEPGTIGSTEIVTLAQQAGRDLSNSERHAIQTFLDESCNGYVSKEDFMHQFVGQYGPKGFKQKFL